MKISDRDKKIIVILLIAAVIALPYVFLIKPTGEKQVAVEGEIATLQSRYDALCALNEQREFYLSEIDRLTTEREEIIESYAPGIRQENIIMFLRDIELTFPMDMSSIGFGYDMVTPISAGTVGEDGTVTGAMDAVKNQTTITYKCDYETIKKFLDFTLTNDYRMVVSSVTIGYDPGTGKVGGSLILEQFAITGDGRELPAAKIPAMDHGNESIFGTYISDEELREQLEEEEGEGETETETEE